MKVVTQKRQGEEKPQVTEPSEATEAALQPQTLLVLVMSRNHNPGNVPKLWGFEKGTTNRNDYPTMSSALSVNTNMIIKPISIN